jgi:hypothetical protein
MYNDNNVQNIFANSLFENVSPSQIKLNLVSRKLVEFDKGEIIYQVGDNSDSFYLIIKGKINITTFKSNLNSSIQDKFENDYFGELEILEKISRRSTAKCAEKSQLCKLNLVEFEELIRNKIIMANLNNAELTNTTNISAAQNNSGESKLGEFDDLNAFIQKFSTSNPSIKLDDLDKGEDDLSWNSTNIEEFKSNFADDNLQNGDEEFYIDDNLDSDIDSENTGVAILTDQPEGEVGTEPLIKATLHVEELIDNNKSVIDQIKDNLDDYTTKLNEKPEEVNAESNEEADFSADNSLDKDSADDIKVSAEISPEEIVPAHSFGGQLSAKEIQELTIKITDGIYKEIIDPIDIIKKYAQIILSNSSSSTANRIIQKIIDQSDYILHSLQTHLAYLNEKLELNPQILNASYVLNEILHLLAGYTEFRKVKLYRKFEADASILIDRNLLYQSFLHITKYLCENITEEGSIYVTVNRTMERLAIEFKSSGSKIPDKLIAKIFDSFTTKYAPGLGLAKRIVVEHNGEISINNSEDACPEIIVSLPIVK